MKLIPYGRQHISEEDINAVVETLKSDFLTQGPKIKEFEDAFAAYIGSKYAVAVSNGTAALHLSAKALGVNESSRVITTPLTFAASANCVRYNGGEVVFADIDPETALLSLEKVREILKKSTPGTYQGIIPVDYAGLPVNMEGFRELADEYGLWLIEDACHAPGGYFTDSKGQKQLCGNGNYADVAVFSFHPVKHIACGEGGMITTNREDIYQQLLLLRTHGISKTQEMVDEHGGWYYEMQTLGYNYRLTDIQSALGISQLKYADERLQRRKEIAKRYEKAFEGTGIKRSVSRYREGHAYHLYVIETADRKGLYDYLRARKILVQVHYIPLHFFPYYQGLGYKKGDYPEAESFYRECLTLPMYPTLTEEDQAYVIQLILEFIDGSK